MLTKFRILIAASVALAAGCALAPSASAIVVHSRTGQFLGVASRPGATIAGSVAATSSAGGASGVAITSYTWSFGDGATGTGAIPSHAYPAPGSYKVKLTVTDAAGARISTTQTVTVLDEPPIAVFGASPAVPIPGQPVTFDGSSSSDPDATIVSYAWDFGDGATATGAAPRDLRLRPAAAGRAQCDDVHGSRVRCRSDLLVRVELRRRDDGRRASRCPHLRERWHLPCHPHGDRPLRSDFEHQRSRDGHRQRADRGDLGPHRPPPRGTCRPAERRALHDVDDPIVSYLWHFGDRSGGVGKKLGHTFARSGYYSVSLTVRDSHGQTATSTATVHVGRAGAVSRDLHSHRRRRRKR